VCICLCDNVGSAGAGMPPRVAKPMLAVSVCVCMCVGVCVCVGVSVSVFMLV